MRKLTIFILCAAMIFTSSVTAFGETKVLTNTEKEVRREQPPENWQYAGEIFYNKGVVGATTTVLVAVIESIKKGNISPHGIALNIANELAKYGIFSGDDFEMYVKKIGFYKQSTDNSGFPFYCHDVIYYYTKKNGRYILLYGHDDYYHSYTPQIYG